MDKFRTESLPEKRFLISWENVTKVYSSEAGEFSALKNINVQIFPGEFVGIIGKSGAGKSTFLNMLTGVDHLTSGAVLVNSPGTANPISIHAMSENELARWRGQNMGVIFQSFQLLPMLTLTENIMLPIDLCGKYHPSKSRDIARNLLHLVELDEHEAKLPAYISGGQQQRVAIARALANNPPILVADEPTGSLDSLTADSIFALFETLVEQGKTIVMVTHDNSLGPRFSRRLYMTDGQITEEPVTDSPKQ